MTTVDDTDRGTVLVDGRAYAAESVAGGAAYELFSEVPAPGFLRLDNPHRWAYQRFVPAAEVAAGHEVTASTPESPLCAPLSRAVSWEHVHRASQRPPRDRQAAELIATVRASAVVRRGSRPARRDVAASRAAAPPACRRRAAHRRSFPRTGGGRS